jgi:hypothetical protein
MHKPKRRRMYFIIVQVCRVRVMGDELVFLGSLTFTYLILPVSALLIDIFMFNGFLLMQLCDHVHLSENGCVVMKLMEMTEDPVPLHVSVLAIPF